MWIHDSNAPTANLRVPAMPDDAEPVDIPDSGVVQVRQDVGTALIEACETITKHDPDNE